MSAPVAMSNPEWAVVGGVAVLVIAIIASITRRQRPKHDPDAGLAENLTEYPPAPTPGTHRLTFEGQPVRLRLVVLAPAGNMTQINAEMAEGLLKAVLYGLDQVVKLDRPRIRVWPPQLSQDGFKPKFFSNTHRDGAAREASRWILAAGPAQAGQKTFLLGLALETTEPTLRGNVRMSAEKWTDKLRVQVVG